MTEKPTKTKQHKRENFFPGEQFTAHKEQLVNKKFWSREEEEKLEEIVSTLKEKGDIDWYYVGQQFDRPSTVCFNKYISLHDKQFTELENAKLAKWWKKNQKDREHLDYDALQKMFPKHHKRSIQIQLQNITKGSAVGEYRMTEEEWRQCEL